MEAKPKKATIGQCLLLRVKKLSTANKWLDVCNSLSSEILSNYIKWFSEFGYFEEVMMLFSHGLITHVTDVQFIYKSIAER
eukprot:UN20083